MPPECRVNPAGRGRWRGAGDDTAAHDQRDKLEEYKSVASLDAIVFVDPDRERVRLVRRTGPEAWAEAWLQPHEDVTLPTLDVVIPQAELFARD